MALPSVAATSASGTATSSKNPSSTTEDLTESNSSKKSSTRKGETVRVKEERPDDAEIDRLAAQMMDAHKAAQAKQAAAQQSAQAPSQAPGGVTVAGQATLLNYMSSTRARPPSVPGLTPLTPPSSTDGEESDKVPLDVTSQKGKFGWVTIGDEYLPFILRAGEKYLSVRMVELKLLNKYFACLHQDVYACTCIRSFFVTEAEARLLSEINMKHCEGRFGREMFTMKDLVVKLEDATEYHDYLELCYTKLTNPMSSQNCRCGFVQINNESVVPYTVREENKYVPLFYFEGETDTLKKRSSTLGTWDLAYLKFCCKVQGIRSELFATETCQVIGLSDIKAYFPPGTKFDEYWPSKTSDPSLAVSSNHHKYGAKNAVAASMSWIKVPPGAPPVHPSPVDPPAPLPGRIPSASCTQVSSNGWSALLSSAPRYHSSTAHVAPASSPVGAATSRLNSTSAAAAAAAVAQLAYNNATANGTNISRNYIPRGVQQNISNLLSSQQYYPGVNHTSGHPTISLSSPPSNPPMLPQAPTSLVRVSSANPSLSTPTYSSAASMSAAAHSSSMQMMSNGLMPPPNMQYTAHNNNNTSSKSFPPALLPVNGANSRYYGTGSDVIDLSSPPHSPQRSMLNGGKQTPQPAHQQSRSSPSVIQQAAGKPENNGGWNKLIPISDSPARQSNHYPFKMQKALVNGKMVPCINSKPYVYSELLMTVNDLLEYFFPGVSMAKCREVLQNVLQVTLYSGNLQQKTVLRENNKCKTLNEVLPLIQLKDVMQYMPQLKYVMERHTNNNSNNGGETASKRARIS